MGDRQSSRPRRKNRAQHLPYESVSKSPMAIPYVFNGSNTKLQSASALTSQVNTSPRSHKLLRALLSILDTKSNFCSVAVSLFFPCIKEDNTHSKTSAPRPYKKRRDLRPPPLSSLRSTTRKKKNEFHIFPKQLEFDIVSMVKKKKKKTSTARFRRPRFAQVPSNNEISNR